MLLSAQHAELSKPSCVRHLSLIWLSETESIMRWRSLSLALLMLSVLAGCRGRRGPALPPPEDFSQLIFIGIFALALLWLLLKLLRG